MALCTFEMVQISDILKVMVMVAPLIALHRSTFFLVCFETNNLKKLKFTKTKKEENVALMAFVTDALQWGG